MQELYVALRAVDRVVSDLANRTVVVDPQIRAVLDESWGLLAGGVSRERDLSGIWSAGADEQDAATDQILSSLLLSAVDALLLAVDQDDGDFSGVIDTTMEYWFYVVEQQLASAPPGTAVVVTEDDIADVENHADVVAEVDRQANDRRIARSTKDLSALRR